AERGRVQGFFGAVWGIAGVSGPLLGGAIVALASWRWVFWINLPLGLATLAVLAFAYREAPRARQTSRLDLGGAAAILVSSLALLLAASDVLPLVTAGLGVVLAVAFVMIEKRVKDPLLPIGLVIRPRIAVAATASLLLGASMMGVLSFLPLHVQGVLSGAPTEAGLVIAPMLVGWPLASAMTSRLLMRIGYRRPIRIGVVLAALSFAAMAWLVVARAPMWALGASMFGFGTGMGLANTALLIGVQASVGWEQRGVATALTQFARTMGGALGVGALGALLAARLGASLPPETVRALLEAHEGSAMTHDARVIDALGAALGPLFWVGAASAALAFLVVMAQPADESFEPTPAPAPAE
ncbi:MAG: MFS transporter, partial [Myxococcales bacterium]|nr:MFS transporter [Myxococcales bacterium]